ncbi:MAG: crossover junction endodeoxyribonuclease RuvC [Megasphaera sp.]|jgi:crossover junction endodeoxyribonuclease RuvC|nr:crossover junction endodeoxyribonuclease RuvC [Megasphaera sp.]MCH4188698.1 crossover junction endodeoxyribonuclease RuvC [Megasphaera sp.]MCH4218259.1 crossover junction endodeoxyribonuclease RuvC [Megasphaera sp.]
MRAMGIDPGTAICGFGVVDSQSSRLKPVTYGTIQTTPDHTDAERLVTIFNGLNALYDKYKPDVIGVEQLFFNRNVTTAIAVGQARGIILLTAQQAAIPILEFSPLQVKQGVTGYGRATKEQVIDMTMRLLNIHDKIKPDDAADGLAMAIYALYCNHSQSLKRTVQL